MWNNNLPILGQITSVYRANETLCCVYILCYVRNETMSLHLGLPYADDGSESPFAQYQKVNVHIRTRKQ